MTATAQNETQTGNGAGCSPAEVAMPASFAVLSSRTFGPFSRYRLDVCRTRFGTRHFMVFDAEVEDPITGRPDCIRQADSEEEALRGLPSEEV